MLQGGYIDSGLFTIEDDHWKFARKMLSSEFTSGKLKKVKWLTITQYIFLNKDRLHQKMYVELTVPNFTNDSRTANSLIIHLGKKNLSTSAAVKVTVKRFWPLSLIYL